MRKYFSNEVGTPRDVMYSGPTLRVELLQTISAGKNIFQVELPPNTYKSKNIHD